MGLISKIRGHLRRSHSQADTPIEEMSSLQLMGQFHKDDRKRIINYLQTKYKNDV